MNHVVSAGVLSGHPLWDGLISTRDAERDRVDRSIFVVKGKELEYELTPQGYLQWYLHPDLHEPSVRSLMFYRQEIPPGSRGALMRHPGGLIHLILEGHGEYILDGVSHEFWAADCVLVPITGIGVTYQFVNLERDSPVRFVAAMPNLFDPLGVDFGAGFEVVEPAPEYVRAQEASS